MKKLFPLNEALLANGSIKNKEIKNNRNREKDYNKIKSPFPLRRNNNYEIKYQNNKKQKGFHKTPGKVKEIIKLNKILENNVECVKTNNNSTINASKDKQLFLVACLLSNNKNNIDKNLKLKTNNILLTMNKNKEYKKYVNKIQKSLLPGKKPNKQRKKILNVNENNNNNIDIIKDNNIDNNLKDNNNIIYNFKIDKIENNKIKNFKKNIENNLKEINMKINNNFNININKESDNLISNNDISHKIINKEKNENILINKDNNKDNKDNNKDNYISNDDIDLIKSYNNLRTINCNNHKKDMKIFVNTSNNIKYTEKRNKNFKIIDLNKSVKTPKNIFKDKIINITNNKIDNNKLNKSDNMVSLNPKKNNSLIITKKSSVKSNSLEKYLHAKKLKFKNWSVSKNLFKIVNNKKRNRSSHFLSIPNNTNSNKYINRKRDRRTIKENKSCDTLFHKENSVDNVKINIERIINNNEENILNENTIKNKITKKNIFKNLKLKKFKKHKSQDFNTKNNLNNLVMSHNDINNIARKKENKTPDKSSQKLLQSFQKELNNNNIHIINPNNNINNNNNNNNNKSIYTYNILPNNNGKLIEKCLLNRNNWEAASIDKKNYCNFIWTPLSFQINYSIHTTVENAQIINHFEYHCELTNKSKTFINLFRYCEFNEINLFSFYPLTIIFTFNSNTFNSQIESFKKLYNDVPDLIFNEKDKDKDKENNKNILNKYYIDYFNVNLSKKIGSVQKMKIPKTHYIGKNMWLLKRDNLNRGRKIKVLSNLDDIIKEINTLYEQKSPYNLLIQKYIEQPLLYHKRKFDIRIWVLFTFVKSDNKYEVYVFKEGHLKACSDEFNINSDDLFIHLTNYSVQKHNKNFSKSEIGNEISFNDFQKELNENHNKEGKNIDFRKDIFPEIIKIIGLSANSVKGKINLSNRNNCFEIFGYDFILDINYRPFLLEINTNPGYEESSPLIKMLVPRMIDDALKLTIDKEFETTYKNEDNNNGNIEEKNKSKYEVEGYSSIENMWLKLRTKL